MLVSALRRTSAQFATIAYQDIQDKRSVTLVPYGLGGMLHVYVPFYFAPRSPMLCAISYGRVPSCQNQAAVVHHEGLDGQLLVQYRGRTIPTQEAPPRPGVLRASNGPLRYGPGLDRRVNGVGSHPKESLASLDAIEADSATLNGGGRVRKPPASPRRKPTPRQRVRWKAVQRAKLRGLSIRAIARELGIHRNTVRTYAEAKSPPMMRTRGRSAYHIPMV